MTLTTHQAAPDTTPRHRAGSFSVHDPSPERLTLPPAAGPVSAAIRVTLAVSPDQPRIILSLVGQIERAIIATPDLLADDDLLTADRMLEGLHESLWAEVDERWVDDAELIEARSTLRSAIREERPTAVR
ncbi:MAG: hypothetical protein RJQ01_10885 [Microcella sp.]|uniref:hypothetical protein n=1 Tax=Microcella sp. TaxID=1913979 RepID=UPI003315A41D